MRKKFHKLRDEYEEQLAPSTGGKIVGRSQVAPAEVEKWQGEVSRACANVDNFPCEVQSAQNANLSFRHDLKAPQQRCDMAISTMAAERDSAMSNSHGKMVEFRLRFDERIAQLEG